MKRWVILLIIVLAVGVGVWVRKPQGGSP
ncbi:MAG: hypothetical protein UX92_C0007G0001, partial [Candidatus Amesbacteria bacterium GW2011_GWA1_47_20]